MNKKNHSVTQKIVKKWGARKDCLIEVLHDVQEEHNYLPREILTEVSEELEVPLARVFEIATFYKGFSLTPRGRFWIGVCMGTACHVRGAPMILDELKRQLSIEPGETTEDDLFTLETVNCVGACALGPIVISDGNYHGQMKTREVNKLINKIKKEIKE